jgi:hypothetical protein
MESAQDLRVGSLGGIDDLLSALVQHRVIVSFHPNSDDFMHPYLPQELPSRKSNNNPRKHSG